MTNKINILFFIIIAIYSILGLQLIWNIPYTYPFGGPDEAMHISMAEYISKHLSWPHWDSKELLRNAYGVSYSTGSSIVYWIHGIFYKIFEYHRMGSFFLLILYLLLTTFFFIKNKISGLILLAALLPQTLFVFSYVNSDGGTILTALLFGVSIGLFLHDSYNKKYLLLLFFFAGLTVTARQHLWAVSFFSFLFILFYKRDVIKYYYKQNRSIIILSLFLALLPASWWFVTSFISNDGDILGVFTNVKSIKMFSTGDLPSLARDWKDFSVYPFLKGTLISLYANWGWLSLNLPSYAYWIIGIIFTISAILLYKFINKPIKVFIAFVIIINFILMIIYSVFYDYQAQGRYLFPSIYIAIGLLSFYFLKKDINSKKLQLVLMVFIFLNLLFTIKLTLENYSNIFLKEPEIKQKTTYSFYPDAKLNIDKLEIVKNKLFISGWAYDKKTDTPFSKISFILEHKDIQYEIPLKKQERIDIVNAFKNPHLKKAGFLVKNITLKQIEKGAYEFYFIAHKNNKDYVISKKMKTRVK